MLSPDPPGHNQKELADKITIIRGVEICGKICFQGVLVIDQFSGYAVPYPFTPQQESKLPDYGFEFTGEYSKRYGEPIYHLKTRG